MAALAFGTVQLGEAYGRHPQLPSAEDAVALLLEAAMAGVVALDTASNYGLAEERVGLAVRQLPAEHTRWQVVTKIDEVEAARATQLEDAVDRSVALSLQRLGVASLDCCCIHNFEMWLAHDRAAWRRLCHHRDLLGTVGRCGVSVATFTEALACLADPSVQHIQLPVSLLDHRWRHLRAPTHGPGTGGASFEEVITRAVRDRGVTVHARSCFLQGTLVNDTPLWPEWTVVEGWPQRVLEPIDRLVRALNRSSRADLCVAYARALPWVTHVLIGMRSSQQLAENLALFDSKKCPPLSRTQVAMVERQLPYVSERLLSPWLWNETAWGKVKAAARL